VLFLFRSGCWFSLRSVLHFLACSILSQHHRSSVLQLELFPHQFLVCVKVVTLLRESVTRSFFRHCRSSSLSRSRVSRFKGSPSIGPPGLSSLRDFSLLSLNRVLDFITVQDFGCWLRPSSILHSLCDFCFHRVLLLCAHFLLRSSGSSPTTSVVLLGVAQRRAPPWCCLSVGFQWSMSSVLGPSFGCSLIHKKS
jgi:hypothetical protein